MQPGAGQPGRRSILQESRDKPWENKKTLEKKSSCDIAKAKLQDGKAAEVHPKNVVLKTVAICTPRVPSLSPLDH